MFFLNFFLRILRLHLNTGSSCRDSGAVDANRGLGSQLDVALLAENGQLVRLIDGRYSAVVIDGRFASHFGSKEGRGRDLRLARSFDVVDRVKSHLDF